MTGIHDASSGVFERARDAILAVSLRPELTWQVIASPERIAPHSVALAAGIKQGQDHEDAIDSPSGSGRFVLMYDPDSSEEWGADFRVVCFAQAPLEVEIGMDDYISDVAWSWLTDALDAHHAGYAELSGTVTKIISQGYGGLARQGKGSLLELRASWTPEIGDAGAHARAWSELMCSLAGFPHEEGTVSLDAFRNAQARNHS